jgi:threonine synthase
VSDGSFSYPYGPALLPRQEETAGGLWRWRRLLPLDGPPNAALEVGNTPLLASDRLRSALGLPSLVLKDETRTPTGSNKDRATALCVADALAQGKSAIAAASSGNVAVSLAWGAAASGLQAYVFVPGRSVSPSKVALMRAFGATVLLVDAPYEQAYRLSEAACSRFGWYSRNTGRNPLALQAKKTVAFEVWEQLGGRLPAVAYLPVGDGVTLAAFVHGCEELVRCGVAERLPVVIGVQASGAAPLARAFAAGADRWEPVEAQTIADGIAVGDPYFGAQALAAVRQTGGRFVQVEDARLQEAIALLARTSGLLAEPAGVAALAGVIEDRQSATEVEGPLLALVSGTGLKDQRWLPSASGSTLEIEADLDALARALAG